MADEIETPADAPARPAGPLWVGLLTWVAVAIVALVAIQVIGIVAQAAALGSETKSLNFSDRLGYSFLQNLDQAPLAFELLLAVVLVLLPVILKVPSTSAQDRAALVVLVGVAALSLLIAIGGAIGVPARMHIIDLQRGDVTPVVRRVLFTFVVRNVATSVLALVAALAAVRVRYMPSLTLRQTATPAS